MELNVPEAILIKARDEINERQIIEKLNYHVL